LMPEEFGWSSLVVVVLYLVLHFALQFGLTLRVLRWMRLLVPADDRLEKIVTQQSAKSGIHVRATWILESEQAQAFAFMTTGEILFTTGILQCCDDEELAAICAHELAHLSESRWIVAGRLLVSFNLMPFIFITPFVHLFGLGGFFLVLGLFLFANWASPKLSHRLEKRADEIAKAQELNEGVYARALLKLYEQNLMPAVNPGGQQTHPSLYDRLLNAGITPDFPRPAVPEKVTPILQIYSAALGIFFALNLLGIGGL
jgi:Zn-dependent protease with chaperone function